MKKDFFMYMGSESTPPCREGVFRFVLTTPIYLNMVQYQAFYQTTINHDVERMNVRKLQDKGLRSVYFVEDTFTQCANLLYRPFDPRPAAAKILGGHNAMEVPALSQAALINAPLTRHLYKKRKLRRMRK